MSARRKKKRSGQKSLDFALTREGKIRVDKLEAARRQLETAVSLWFHDGDPVSIHTLVMASHEILRVLNQAQNEPPMLGEPCPQIRDEYTDLWKAIVRDSAGFFKHSSSDAGETHYFPPAINDAAILDATECYHRLTSDVRPLFRLFKWHMRLHVPDLFLEMPVIAPDLKTMTKPRFFDALISVASDPAPVAEQLAQIIARGNWGRTAGLPTPKASLTAHLL